MVNLKFDLDTINQFYPTPEPLIKELLEPWKKESRRFKDSFYYDFAGATILEPSAGKGNILDFIEDNKAYSYASYETFVIEIDEDLRNILKGKDYALIHNDFLSFESGMHFDTILMNPPFRVGVDHLLKAWDIVVPGGKVACVLNAETLKNPFTAKRKRLQQIISEHGSKKYIMGAFESAERKANVEVALVWLTKPENKSEWDFDAENFSKSSDQEIKEFINGERELGDLDYLDSLIRAYHKGMEHFDKMMIEYERVKMFLKVFERSQYDGFEELIKKSISDKGNKKNYFVKGIKRHAWRYVVSKMDIERYFTAGVSQKFDSFINDQQQLEFSRKNIFEFLEGIFQNRHNIMKESLLEIFDKMCSHDAKNKIWLEDGFKTNSAYKVNQKVIIPYVVRYGEYLNSYQLKDNGDKFSLSYDSYQYLSDVDRVLCHLMGYGYPMPFGSIRQTLEDKFKQVGTIKTGDFYSSTCESAFFEIKFFKKGTIHLKFKDKKVWKALNRKVAEYRNWLTEDVNN